MFIRYDVHNWDMSVREKLRIELDWAQEETPDWVNKWTALTALTALYTLVGTALQTQLV
jgi:hypothetical protein